MEEGGGGDEEKEADCLVVAGEIVVKGEEDEL